MKCEEDYSTESSDNGCLDSPQNGQRLETGQLGGRGRVHRWRDEKSGNQVDHDANQRGHGNLVARGDERRQAQRGRQALGRVRKETESPDGRRSSRGGDQQVGGRVDRRRRGRSGHPGSDVGRRDSEHSGREAAEEKVIPRVSRKMQRLFVRRRESQEKFINTGFISTRTQHSSLPQEFVYPPLIIEY